MRGVFLDAGSLRPDELDLSALYQAVPNLTLYGQTDVSATVDRIRLADIVICNKTRMVRESLGHAPNLKLIAVAATGVDNVDVEAAKEKAILVCNARGYSTPSVVQMTFTMILALMTRLLDYHQATSSGAWQKSSQYCLLTFPFSELAGKTIGIFGYGEIGRAVSQAAQGFGMVPLIAERRGMTDVRDNRRAFEEVLAHADIVTVHCPLLPETKGLIAREEIALMKKDALLINAARGGVVDEIALRDALRQGRIAGAGVDVLTNEPPTEGNPLLNEDIPHLIVTPHIAWASREARQRLVDQIAENIHAFEQGTPKNVVNP